MTQQGELYMRRCIQLAVLGNGNVAPNPMVGAVLVFDGKIIGEGYHQKYGEAHAEVNCIASVKEVNQQFIEKSTLYVSLEPCAHYGKTPPCSDLIIQKKIPKVVIGCRDPFKEVNGRGIEKLKAAGIETITGILEDDCKKLNKRFFIFQTEKRAYIILKWAQTANKKIGVKHGKRLLISSKITNRLAHKWRSEEAAILVGTNTALVDNPSLTNRLWTGKSPIRLVVDKMLKLGDELKIFNNEAPIIVFNYLKHSINTYEQFENQVYYFQVDRHENPINQIVNACYKLNIQSILVEGGAKLLQSFIDGNLYEEMRIITNKKLVVNDGVDAPNISNAKKFDFFVEQIDDDTIEYFL